MFKFISLAIFVFAFNFITCSARLDWYEFKSSEFSITFPDKPDSSQKEIPTEYGDLLLNMFMYDDSKFIHAENFAYVLAYSDYPDSLTNYQDADFLKNFFRKSIDGAVTNVHGKKLSEEKIKLGKYQGREVRVNFKEGAAIITVRIYLIKNRMYMLQVITDTKNDFNKSIDKFFNSFKLIE